MADQATTGGGTPMAESGDKTNDRPQRRPAMTATLHIDPDAHVRVLDLTRAGGPSDLVELHLGDLDVGVSVLGTLAEITAILKAAVSAADRVAVERKADGR